MAERIKLSIDKALADDGMIFEHLGYEILSTYYYLQDILQKRTYDDDYLYDPFRELAIMTQEYAKKHPAKLDISDQLKDAAFPELISKLDQVKSTEDDSRN